MVLMAHVKGCGKAMKAIGAVWGGREDAWKVPADKVAEATTIAAQCIAKHVAITDKPEATAKPEAKPEAPKAAPEAPKAAPEAPKAALAAKKANVKRLQKKAQEAFGIFA